MEEKRDVRVAGTAIPGLLLVRLTVHRDGRGWFKESFQRAKLEAEGFPRFEVVQGNVSYNADVGVTRGFHAEPWDSTSRWRTGGSSPRSSTCGGRGRTSGGGDV